MSLGQNLQFLRRMRNQMTQEELAEKLGVSRQTVSKWELDSAYPEMDKVVELCKLFSCTMDELVRENMDVIDEAYSDIREEDVEAFSYISYAVVSIEPEHDAIEHVRQCAKEMGIMVPKIIGWDFPVVSQEQVNVYNMHGYTAALILDEEMLQKDWKIDILRQEKQKYVAITIKQPSRAPFHLIPNAYKVLMTNMKVNGRKQKADKKIIFCFEKEYEVEGIDYMDVYIAVE